MLHRASAGRRHRLRRAANLVVALLAGLLALPASRADVEIAGPALVASGLLHVSYDRYTTGSSRATLRHPSVTSIESNSSQLGLRGRVALGAQRYLRWQFDTEVDAIDDLGATTAMDRWIGAEGRWGLLSAGISDTPLTRLADEYMGLSDTVADRTGILGQTSDGISRFNARAHDMLAWRYRAGRVTVDAMAARRFERPYAAQARSSRLDSLRVSRDADDWSVGIAHESHAATGTQADGRALRVAGRRRFGALTASAVHERLADRGQDRRIRRRASALALSWEPAPDWTLAAQYMRAGRSPGRRDGASLLAFGVTRRISPRLELYVVHARLANQADADYRMAASDHGQTRRPETAGRSARALSVGLLTSF